MSARAIERELVPTLSRAASIREVPLVPWLDTIFPSRDANRPGETLRLLKTDFIWITYACSPFAVPLLWARTRVGARVRFIYQAHTVNTPWLWFVIAPLLRAGDMVVVPSETAARVLAALCPGITSVIRVLPLPVRTGALVESKSNRVTSVLRVTPQKLVHRQIEALRMLRAATRPAMEIAGPLGDDLYAETGYTRALRAQIRRLRLRRSVTLRGMLSERDKRALLASARVHINLSVDPHELFGVSCIEALSEGVPVLTTRWSGLPTTVGAAGQAVPVHETDLGWDVDAHEVARGLSELLNQPPSADMCRAQAAPHEPSRVAAAYARAFAEAQERDPRELASTPAVRGASTLGSGLCALLEPTASLGWRDAIALELGDYRRNRLFAARARAGGVSASDRLAFTLAQSCRPYVERMLSGRAFRAPSSAAAAAPSTTAGVDELLAAAARRTRGGSDGKACFAELVRGQRTDLIEEVLRNWPPPLSASDSYRLGQALVACGRFDSADALVRTALRSRTPELASAAATLAARIAPMLRSPAAAELLALVTAWVSAHPDVIDSGPVWRGLAEAAATVTRDSRTVRRARARARELAPVARLPN